MAFAEILQYIPFKNVPTYFQKVSDTAEDFDEIYSKKNEFGDINFRKTSATMPWFFVYVISPT